MVVCFAVGNIVRIYAAQNWQSSDFVIPTQVGIHLKSGNGEDEVGIMMRYLVGLLLLLLIGVACGSNGVPATVEPVSAKDMTASALTTAISASAEPPFDAAALLAELETAVSLWNSQKIQQYKVTISRQQPTWDTQYMTITVADGRVIDSQHSCYPERSCILRQIDPETVTIDALFDIAKLVIGLNDPDTQITFNPTYGYPTSVIYTDASWVISAFERLDDE